MAAQVSLYPPTERLESTSINPLPQLLQTPSGLALLELQGTINLPSCEGITEDSTNDSEGIYETLVGRLVFPEYEPGTVGEGLWQKRVYLYAGKHQRLTGEVKKLPKAMAVIRRRTVAIEAIKDDEQEELEIVEIVKWKIIFSQRPEPVGTHVIEV